MQLETPGGDGQSAGIRSGISEIDALVSFLLSRCLELKSSGLAPEFDVMLQVF